MSDCTLPLLERVRCHFPNQSVFHLILDSFIRVVGLFCVSAVVWVVCSDSVSPGFRLHAGFFPNLKCSGKILPIHRILNYAAHQGNYRHIHTWTFRNSKRKGEQDELQNKPLFIIGGTFGLSFLISLVFSCESSREFWLWALTVSFPVCFSVSVSQSHTSEARTECEYRWACALTETWLSGVFW